MSADDDLLAKLQSLDGFNEGMLETYFEVQPDGEYIEADHLEGAAIDPDSYLAVTPEWLDDQYERLNKQPWFRGKPYNRKDAEDELIKQPAGTFVARVSSQEGHYAISVVRKDGSIEHMLILPSFAGKDSNSPGNTRYRIGTYSTDLFNTVPKLVAYYIVHPFFEDERLLGIVQPEDQDGGLGYFDVKPAPQTADIEADVAYLSVNPDE